MDARKLKRQRLQLDMTQSQLAEELGVSQSLVSAMETGVQRVSIRTTKAMDFVRREHVRMAHFRRAAGITGRTEAELEGVDVEAEIAEQDAEVDGDAEIVVGGAEPEPEEEWVPEDVPGEPEEDGDYVVEEL